MSPLRRRRPVGAEVQPDGATHFRVWAPTPREVRLLVQRSSREAEVPLQANGEGYFSALVPGVGAGTRYRYLLDGRPFADPASRFQPDGPCGPSQVVDPTTYEWRDAPWRGLTLPGQVFYELHVGTFTREGTWRAAMERLADIRRTGITIVEVMPVAEFPGRFGWGYDGVFPYAPTRLYGTPDDFRAFVDHAHRVGLGVVLDVVYNHLGPSGSVLREYASAYFSTRHQSEWGDALNFDDVQSGPVREFFAANAAYWIDEFHLDGLRLDAVPAMHDDSPEHVVVAVTAAARGASGGRDIIVVMENERQDGRLLWPVDRGGAGIDAAWNDDFHHSAVVAVTGRREAYYSDHWGVPQEFVSAAKHGYLFQGQRYAWQKQPRGIRVRGLAPSAFVNYLDNHDQLANSADGSRIHARTSPGRYRAVTALLLLLPGTPLLFQGQEFGASTPFLYFADHEGELAEAVRQGRAQFVSQFTSLASRDAQAHLPVPHDPATFERCKLKWDERERHATHRRLHEDLLALRRGDEAFRRQAPGGVDGAVLAPEAFVLRYEAPAARDERLLLVNLGRDVVAESFAEPLVAPPAGHDWRVRWSSEEVAYGGIGVPEIVGATGWRLPGHSAVVLAPVESSNDGTRTN